MNLTLNQRLNNIYLPEKLFYRPNIGVRSLCVLLGPCRTVWSFYPSNSFWWSPEQSSWILDYFPKDNLFLPSQTFSCSYDCHLILNILFKFRYSSITLNFLITRWNFLRPLNWVKLLTIYSFSLFWGKEVLDMESQLFILLPFKEKCLHITSFLQNPLTTYYSGKMTENNYLLLYSSSHRRFLRSILHYPSKYYLPIPTVMDLGV